MHLPEGFAERIVDDGSVSDRATAWGVFKPLNLSPAWFGGPLKA